ncbi:MAG TPA: hypothetical protein P5117_03155 [Spirochaetia bacterium]|nr:hypothetical protein [Spirochaetia bacterium]
MILVRVRYSVFLLAISLGATVGAGVWSYSVAAAAGMKGPAETSLFLALCAAAVQILAAAELFRQARRKRRELDSIAGAVRYGGILPAERLDRFGPLGDSIRRILKDLSDAGERKSERIASLTGLLRASLALVETPVLVVSPDGLVQEASKGAREDSRLPGLETGKTRVEDILPEAQMRAVLREADRTHQAVELPGHLTFHPVYSTRGQIACFLADLGRTGIRDFLGGLGERKQAPEPAAAKPPNILGRVLGRFGRGSKDTSDRRRGAD